MNFKNLLIAAGLSLVFVSCKKDNKNDTPIDPVTPVKTYSLTENFDSGDKDGYAKADVNLSTGSWSFDNALIGNLAADLKNGAQSVRMKKGNIAMNFDINGLTTVYVKHGKYGSDATSTWQFFKSTDGGVNYTQVGSDITETNTTLVTDSFKVNETGKVRIMIKDITTSTTPRINIDDITFKGTGDPGVTVTPPDTDPGGDDAGTGTAATGRGVTVGTDAPPATGDNSNLLLGNPSAAAATSASGDNYLLDMGYYVESYNSSRGTPNWVSWHLDNTNTTNATKRLDNFAPFSGLPAGFYAVQSNSYSGSGFDRGHNCPSADRTSSANANSATFLMTNMIPQAPQNNQHTWADLENYLRSQSSAGNEVYIIMGSYGQGGVGSTSSATVQTINSGHITVPSNVWKVAVIISKGDADLLRVTSTTRVIAVNTPNINTVDTDWTKYITTVRSIEQATGYNLLSALPQSVQDAIEVKKDSGI